MNNKTLYAILGIIIASAIIFAVTIQIPLDSETVVQFPFKTEHYDIQITGMKNVYTVGERYDFSYILSGYGNQCGSKKVYFPDENGTTTVIASSSSCIADIPMMDFVFDIQKERGTTFGHVSLKQPGYYTVAVEFERGESHPTLKGHQFFVVEKICNDIADSEKQARCLLESYESCQSAYYTTQFPERNGMVSVTAVVTSWNDCMLEVHTDNSAGEHTPYNGIRSICNIILVKDNTLLFDECNNANYPPISLTAQNSKECNYSSGGPDFECFVESFEQCQSATISITRNTIEGDPIFISGIVIVKDGSCHLDFAIDATQDRFGSEGITHRVCSDVYFEDEFFTFECDDGKFGIPTK